MCVRFGAVYSGFKYKEIPASKVAAGFKCVAGEFGGQPPKPLQWAPYHCAVRSARAAEGCY